MQPHEKPEVQAFAERLAQVAPKPGKVDLGVLDSLAAVSSDEAGADQSPVALRASNLSKGVAGLSFAAGMALGIAGMLLVPAISAPTNNSQTSDRTNDSAGTQTPSFDLAYTVDSTTESDSDTFDPSPGAVVTGEPGESRLVNNLRQNLPNIDEMLVSSAKSGQFKLLTPRGLTVVTTEIQPGGLAATPLPSAKRKRLREQQDLDSESQYGQRQLQRMLTQSDELFL